MNALSVITVGVNEWERYTRPLLESVLKVEPAINLICIDNGSTPAYPDVDNVDMVRSPIIRSYAEGLNLGIRAAMPSDWYMVCNNDVLVNKPFANRFGVLDKRCLYGFAEYTGVVAPGVRYLSGWMMLIPHTLVEAIGLFDPEYRPMYFEDADYSYRATQAGFPLVTLDRHDWGFYHIEDERQGERVGYMQKNMKYRHANRAYFQRKHGL